jgi:hypothetical protein
MFDLSPAFCFIAFWRVKRRRIYQNNPPVLGGELLTHAARPLFEFIL